MSRNGRARGAKKGDELRDNNEMGSYNRMQEYLNRVTAAATANTEHMQEMTTTVKLKYDQLVERDA